MHAFVASTCMHVIHSNNSRFSNGFDYTYLKKWHMTSIGVANHLVRSACSISYNKWTDCTSDHLRPIYLCRDQVRVLKIRPP